ncbi:MAG TPA: type II secretion system protein GspC [Steroidobacteraceae bacterium]|jgi:general secretion pathway protein C|nr:type II secretion system protein GspC [Steroidobacteraceae bacterium]
MEMTANIWSPSAGGGGDWRSALLARAPQVVTFILALALAAQLALIVVGFTSRGRQTAPPAVAAAPPVSQLDIAGLVNAHLFGNAVVQNTNGDGANAPPSSMPLVLAGVLATSDPKEGMAIIGESAQAARVVIVGQQVPGGATLHSVYPDRAVIDRNGALESVLLPRRSEGSMAPSPPPPPVASQGPEASIERMRRLVADDPSVIMQVMRPQPVFAGGRMRGFRVYPGANRQAFARLGLRAGDLVTAINGTPLDDKDRAQEIFATLNSSSDARVTVTRNGRQQELLLNLTQVANEAEQLNSGAEAPSPDPAQSDSGGEQ